MDTINMRTTQQPFADIYQHFRFIPPIFLALRETPDVLQGLWQQTYTNYVLNPLPHLFKEKLFLALSYHSHAPYDLRSHSIILHYLGLQEQDILAFLLRPCSTPQEIRQHLLFLHAQPPLTCWSSLDAYLEHILLNCIAHMFLEKEYAEECRIELQRFLDIRYIHLSAVLSVIKLYHHWAEELLDRLSVSDETFIPQQFAQCFATGGTLEHYLHTHYLQCLLEKHNKGPQKQLEALNERMYEFLSIAGHELKTPLTSIKGNIQLLQRRMEHELAYYPVTDGCPPSTIQILLQRADHQVDRLTRLVRDIIEASRIRIRHLNMHMAPYDLTQLIQCTFDQQQQQSPQRILSLSLPTIAVPVSIDKDYIEQVIVNYLSNALKFSGRDKLVKVSLTVEDAVARVSIQDEGPGVAPEEQGLIWESFYQAKNNAVSSGSSIGLGLGLFISRSIIEAHGGQVGIYSTPDSNGSIFWFTLPIVTSK
jgi:signal transduction histidine kinase